MTMPLDGVKVLDFSRPGPGAFCSMLLADFGADVINVQPVVRGSRGATQLFPQGETTPEQFAAYDALGRGKRSIALNLRETGARQVVYDLMPEIDIVLEAYRAGVVDRLGVDYATLSAINPQLVYCALSGYGQTGPYRERSSHDINFVAIGGALGMTGHAGDAPVIPMPVIGDFAGGALYAAFAICLALRAQEQSGRGQYIDMAMSDGVLSLATWPFSQFFRSGESYRRGENAVNGGLPWYDAYACGDGRWIAIGIVAEPDLRALGEVLALEEAVDTAGDREQHDAIRRAFTKAFRSKRMDEWLAVLLERDIPAAPVLEMAEVATDPHNVARGMVMELESPVGPVKQIGVGPKLSETPGRIRRTAPLRGEHTLEILHALGYTEERIAELRERGAVATSG